MNRCRPEPHLLPPGSDLAEAWPLDPTVVFLNHGSFGACPRKVLEHQTEIRSRMEAEPVRFFVRELQGLLDDSRSVLAGFVGAAPEGLGFVGNATTGVNTALHAVPIHSGDEILLTDQGYNACRNAVEATARRTGAAIIEAVVPFPIRSPREVLDAVLDRISPRTRVAVLDHVTSPTGLVFPIGELVDELEKRAVTVIVDGAHAPGMIELDIDAIGAPFYTGNCHKWMCAPKGAAFLSVRDDWCDRTRPLVISHGANAPLGERSRFHHEFDWTGTADPTAWLSVPTAIETIGSMTPGGWPEVRARNRALALEARDELCAALDLAPPAPDEVIGPLAALPLPQSADPVRPQPGGIDPLQERLFLDHAIEVPVTTWSTPPRRAIRVSAQLYNTIGQFRHLAAAVAGALRTGGGG